METLSSSSPASPHPSLSSDHVGPEIVHVYDDSKLEKVSGNFLDEETSSSKSLYALISNIGKTTTLVEVPIPLYVLFEEEVRANFQRR